MNIIMFSGAFAAPYVPEPAYPNPGNHPYRLVWNFLESSKDLPKYVHEPSSLNYPSGVDVYAVLTDYPDLPFIPQLHVNSVDPIGNNHYFVPVLEMYPGSQWKSVMLDRIADFASVDLRNASEFKIFQLRYGADAAHGPMELMRYNFDASGKRYASVVAVYAEVPSSIGVPQLHFKIEACVDGMTKVHSATVNAAEVLDDFSGVSDDVRMVFTKDQVRIYLGQPGTLLVSLALPEPITIAKSASFEMFKPYPLASVRDLPYQSVTDRTPKHLILDGFIIYDGTL